MLRKWKKHNDKSQKVKKEMIMMNDIELKFKIDGLTYWIIDDMIKEKTINDCKINLDTNQFIANLINKALKEFILNHQYLQTEKLTREISLIDEKLEGKEIRFEDIFKGYNFNNFANEKE